MFIFAALALYALARLRGSDRIPAGMAAVAFALSGLVLQMKDAVLSDSTHLFFACLTLVSLVWVERRQWDKSYPVGAAVAIAVLMLLAYGSRAIGLSLVIGFTFYQAVWKRRVTRFNGAVLGVCGVGVLLLMWTLYDSRSYTNQFVFAPAAYLRNVWICICGPRLRFGRDRPALVRYVAGSLILIVALCGSWGRSLTNASVVECYAVTATIPVILYSAGYSERYLIPILRAVFHLFCGGCFLAAAALLPRAAMVCRDGGFVLCDRRCVQLERVGEGPVHKRS